MNAERHEQAQQSASDHFPGEYEAPLCNIEWRIFWNGVEPWLRRSGE